MGSARRFPFALSLIYRGGFASSILRRKPFSRPGVERQGRVVKQRTQLGPYPDNRMAPQKRVSRSIRWSHLEDRLYEHVQEAVRLPISLDVLWVLRDSRWEWFNPQRTNYNWK